MKASRKLKRIQERRFSAHHMLIRAAAIALERGKKKQPGWLFDKDLFIEKLDAEQKFGLTSDGWSGSTKAHDG